MIGSDPGYSVTNTREIGVIHDIKIMKGDVYVKNLYISYYSNRRPRLRVWGNYS